MAAHFIGLIIIDCFNWLGIVDNLWILKPYIPPRRDLLCTYKIQTAGIFGGLYLRYLIMIFYPS
ncbi:hypothetical protein Desru_1971 [Desulforamulus ruminis DSM 2154]|uniref:Uncharacterized protein n=1 Tax=Desulforamulus ruminis (strain ATCC 23193 / DSM 2154 / NCIMB 8452 / DL) TaxID=696281 RepID=F6DUT9_DESRL|nr:hypothetical protein Desru_1971 [Desulforamulus ruminis DSM 2154]